MCQRGGGSLQGPCCCQPARRQWRQCLPPNPPPPSARLLPHPCRLVSPRPLRSNTHYYRYRSIGWIVQYAMQNGLMDPNGWTVDNGAGVLGSNAYWTTVLDVQGADIGTSTTLATPCDVDPLHPTATAGRRLAAAGTVPPTQARRGVPPSLPPPKRLVPRITGTPPIIRAKPAMSRAAFVQSVLAANTQRVRAWGGRPLAV